MKLKIYFVLAILFAFAACKTTYKATDRPTVTNSTSATVDSMATSASKLPATTDSIKTPSKVDSVIMPSKPDSARVLPTDSIKMPTTSDSTKVSLPVDSAKRMPLKLDSAKAPSTFDSTKLSSKADSTKMPSAADPVKLPSKADSTKISLTEKSSSADVKAPAAVQTVFTTQYPDATNVVWARYDSLAAVPIDLRMAGWKKMNAEDLLVKFDLKDNNYYAWYDSDGKWVGSAYTMKEITKLPVPVNTAIKNAIKTKYQGYEITNVNKEFQKGKTAYEVELKKEDSTVKMLVNADGKIAQVFKYVKEKTK